MIRLEKLKVDDPLVPAYNAEGRRPDVCGISPESITVEVRQKGRRTAVTYWHYWKYDIFPGDHPDWEPVTLVYSGDELERAYARVHNGLVSYAPNTDHLRQQVFFASMGHTPVVNVKDSSRDVRLHNVKDGMDGLRRTWLNRCYDEAAKDRWKVVRQIPLKGTGAPALDSARWGSWGKHSVYLRI